DYVKNRDPKEKQKHYISESKITDVRITNKHNYRVSFCDQSDIVLKPAKKEPVKPAKKKIATTQVRMSVSMHQEMKKIAEQENREMREIIDTACEQYMKQNYHKKLF